MPETFTIRATVSGFERMFRVQIERLSDLTPALRETGREIREEIKSTFAKGQSRSGRAWAPLAEATKKNLENTTTTPTTRTGKVRAKYVNDVARYLRRNQKAGKADATLLSQEFYRLTHGGDHTTAIDDAVAGSFRRLRRSLAKTPEQHAKRRKGSRAIDRHNMLGKIVNMIGLRVARGVMEVGLIGKRAGLVGSKLAIHNVGGKAGNNAIEPARPFAELLPIDVERFIARIQQWIVPD